MKHLLLSLALCLGGGIAALAQPTFVYGPAVLASATPRAPASAMQRTETCERPPNTVAPGDTLIRVFPTDDGRDGPARITNVEPLRYGLAEVVVDSFVVYEGLPDLAVGGFDTVRIERCRIGGTDCAVTEYVFGTGRPGRSASFDVTIGGGETAGLRFPVPPGDLFCGSVTDDGTYDARDRRSVGFVGGAVSDTLVYDAARAPGTDGLTIVVCNVVGTCDTAIWTVGIAGATATLPFCEDFSAPGARPDPAVWLEDDVFVNNSFAIAPPTIGVATFDGLDEGGLPYGDGVGKSDVLTSTFIDTRGAGNLYLKYFLEPGGRGQAPEEIDFMLVEGRDASGDWVELNRHFGSRTSEPQDTFTYYEIALDGSALAHAEFQVRFTAVGNQRGNFDLWHLDYVRVEEGDGGPNFDDIALTEPPSSLLEPYSAVPLEQFRARPDLVTTQIDVAINNLFAETNNVSTPTVTYLDASGDVLAEAGLLAGSQFNLPPGRSVFFNDVPPGPAANLRAAVQQLGETDAARITTRYELGVDADQEQIACVLRNDRAEAVNSIGDLYAYDDGTAEGGLLPGGQGERLVVRYEAFTQDTLRGLQLFFTRTGPLDAERQLINLQVYLGPLDDNDLTPDYEEVLTRPFFPSTVGDTLQAFTTYALVDAFGEPTELVVPPGEFYVGYQLASDVASPVPVGLDVSRDNTDAIFAEFGSGWFALPELGLGVTGSLMIRPVFSEDPVTNSSPTRETADRALRLYPNPSDGRVRIGEFERLGAGARYEVRDAGGRVVAAGPAARELRLDLPGGVYVVRVLDGATAATGRIVVSK